MDPGKLFDEWLEGTVYRDRQVAAHGVHLTVAEVLLCGGRGSLDFGGSEFVPADARPLDPEKRNSEDDYGWWTLETGSYIVRFNEKLKEGAPAALLTANGRLLACGCALGALICAGGDVCSVLTVPDCGVDIKENARIALLRPPG
ncbi:MAG: dCTP deaminase/dUTPase family protein [Planctomycetota bacterium]|jgi:hypothetical protein